MEKEFLILSQLEKNELLPQREIASVTGLSLGTVNLLLKKMARKGLVKVERLNKRNLSYILTPRGMAEKSRLAYSYARRSYRFINMVIKVVQNLLKEENKKHLLKEVIIFGEKDDFGEILALSLSLEKLNYRFVTVPENIPAGADAADVLLLVWDERYEKELQKVNNISGLKIINVLKYL